MPGLYSLVYTESAGNTILASRRNAEHQNHIDKMEPQYMDDYSANVTTMRTTEDPGESGSESLATTLQGELTRLRHAVLEVKQTLDSGITYWYETPTISTAVAGPASSTDNALPRFNGTGGGTIQNSNIIVSDLDVLNVKTTTLVTSSVNTTFSSTTVTDASAWDLSAVLAGDYAVASGGSVGLINTVDDGGDQLTVDSWVGGTPSNGETVAVERRGQVEIDNTLTVGDGTGTGTDPDLTINKNTGDAKLRLQVGNSSSTAWDIAVDNDDSDALDLDFNSSTRLKLAAGSAQVRLTNSGSDEIVVDPSVVATSATPAIPSIYSNTVVQAHGLIASGATLTNGYNIGTITNPSTGRYIVNFKRAMANATYTVIVTPVGSTSNDSLFGFVYSKGTSSFGVGIYRVSATAHVAADFHVTVIGELS